MQELWKTSVIYNLLGIYKLLGAILNVSQAVQATLPKDPWVHVLDTTLLWPHLHNWDPSLRSAYPLLIRISVNVLNNIMALILQKMLKYCNILILLSL